MWHVRARAFSAKLILSMPSRRTCFCLRFIVVTFASPSAVRVWAERAGTDAAAVCIGETSAAECRRVGFEEVRCPDSPGVESWADAIAAFYGVEA